jgi:hypothetical protein
MRHVAIWLAWLALLPGCGVHSMVRLPPFTVGPVSGMPSAEGYAALVARAREAGYEPRGSRELGRFEVIPHSHRIPRARITVQCLRNGLVLVQVEGVGALDEVPAALRRETLELGARLEGSLP